MRNNTRRFHTNKALSLIHIYNGKNDYEFLPDGSYKWTAKKYEAKLQNLSKVLSSLSRNLVPEGPAVIGVAEVENCHVLTDLVSQSAISNYKFVHYEGCLLYTSRCV